jgi:hypothetical protein
MSTLRITLVAVAVLVLCLGASVAVLRPIDNLHSSVQEDVLYVPSAKMLRRMSLGYDGLMADLYWTRAVQYYGRQRAAKARNYPLLYPLLDITTDLDPKLLIAYQYGAIFLSEPMPGGAGRPDQAAKLVEKGIRDNPNNWRMYYSLGFLEYMDRKDYAAAERAFDAGSRVPGAPPWMKVMAASMAQRANDATTARAMWAQLLESTDSKQIKVTARIHLMALQVDEEVPVLDALVNRFHEANGRYPTNFAEMVAMGWLRGVPRDPLGEEYILSPDGNVYVQHPKDFYFITKGLPPGQQAAAQ